MERTLQRTPKGTHVIQNCSPTNPTRTQQARTGCAFLSKTYSSCPIGRNWCRSKNRSHKSFTSCLLKTMLGFCAERDLLCTLVLAQDMKKPQPSERNTRGALASPGLNPKKGKPSSLKNAYTHLPHVGLPFGRPAEKHLPEMPSRPLPPQTPRPKHSHQAGAVATL